MINFFFYKRIIINIIYNLYKFKYTSINILPYFKVKSNEIVINNKRLFIVSSCLNPNYNINNVMKIVSDKDDEQIDNSYSYFSGPLPEKVETKLPFQEPFSLFSFPNPFLDLSYKKKD